MSSVSIATKPLVYSTFRYIANKVHNALAEYVDNSVESFRKHIDILSPINDNKVRVDVIINPDEDYIIIKDNAFGIDATNYERAFELANIPLDATGLNEFGMGMKVSSIWLSNYWTVESTAYGEILKKTFAFDLKDVVENQRTNLDIKTEPALSEEHYTIVTLTKLSQFAPSTRQISNIKKHLSSIYSQFIKEGILDLYINEELQEYEELATLNEPYYKTPKADKLLWKRDFEFSAPKYIGGKLIGEYKAHGFIGILNKMSNGVDNGFLLFRRGRVIGTSYTDQYRPKVLCGDEGSPRWKRIYGEMDLEGFDVSFTKNSFNEDEQFETFIEDLRDHISKKWKDFDLFGQAQNYKKPEDPKKTATRVSTSLVSQAGTTVSITTVSNEGISTSESTSAGIPSLDMSSSYSSDESSLITPPAQQDTKSFNSSSETVTVAEPVTGKITIDGFEFELSVGCKKNSISKGLYSLIVKPDGTFEANINLDNNFFERFKKTFASEDSYGSVVNLVRVLSATELMLQNNGKATAGKAFRDQFNKLIGQF
jgi:hypothetical protein